MEFDASPWGGGAVLRKAGHAVEFLALAWDAEVLDFFKAELGNPKWQTTWEFLTLLLALIRWRQHAQGAVLFFLGDNIGALQDAISLKGKGDLMTIAREIAWRKAVYKLSFECAHLPKDMNVTADALSRLAAVPPTRLPSHLSNVPRATGCPWASVWRAWVARAG